MRIYLLILFIFFALVSCEDFEDNRRVLIKGNVSNISELDQDQINVLASFETRISQFSSDQDIIGRASVEENGKFDMVIPVPSSEPVFVALSNSFENSDDDSFQLNIEIPGSIFFDSSFQNLIELGDIEIQTPSKLLLNFISQGQEQATISWQISYFLYPCDLVYDDAGLTSINEFCSEPIIQDGQLSNENQTFEFLSIKNSIAILEYTINEDSTQVIEINLNESINEINIPY